MSVHLRVIGTVLSAAALMASGCAWPATGRVTNSTSGPVKVLLMSQDSRACCVLYDWEHLMDYAETIEPGQSRTFRNFQPHSDTSLAIGGAGIREEGRPWGYTRVWIPQGRTEIVVTGDDSRARISMTGAENRELSFVARPAR